ncbi:hypothetical protein PR202_gb24800 [Eleusine coracana subsp. coracana]|uniref:Serine/threonine-protein phosphatase 4 regulatory subunit 3-like central domain-containing protein n=1 Tax=Eleusine coracana subsp. coracana TaxID=191504 RepID=A0AAV5FJN3_ELECO|nr:hypothetical protein PR202_gb24800 [Eleusine coracana subsp. coracana]
MRTVIGTKDEFLIDRVIKFNLLKPIIEAFVENGDRYNMLHSGVLELLEYIRKENIELLIEYVSKSFWDQLVKFERLGSIQAFKLKYQQILESAVTKPSASLIDMRKRAEERAIDKQEEDYFNKDRPKLVGLVDCDDIEKFFNPPPKRPVEDDQALHIPVRVNKKPKLEVRISCAKIIDKANEPDRHSDLEDLGDRSSGSQIEQSGVQNPDSVHEIEGDCTDTAQNSSPKTD